MAVVGWLVAALVLGLVGVLAFGLLTGRIDWRAESCCPSDPAKDLRMRAALEDPADRDSVDHG